MIKKLTPLIVLLFYSALALIFMRGILFSTGILMGGDWGFPLTKIQMMRYFNSELFTWSDREILGTPIFFRSSLPIQFLIGVLAHIGIDGTLYPKILLFIAFVFPACTMYLLCRFFKCSRGTSLLGGVLYITMPYFFNYVAMGWIFVLLSMGFLPLTLIFFIKSIKEDKYYHSLITGFLYSLAMIQSQTFIWYPITFLCFAFYLIKDKKSFFAYIKSFVIIMGTFVLCNAYWALPLFFGGGSGILNTNLGKSSISLGTWSRLGASNILRGWGSLYNAPYEVGYENGLALFSFVLPIVAYSSLFLFKKNKLVTSLTALSFVLILLFELGPNVIVRIPFSDLIRDVARFTTLTSFSYVVLATLVLNRLFNSTDKAKRVLAGGLIVFLLAATYLFWVGDLYRPTIQGQDVRLRTYAFPKEYFIVENELNKISEDVKVLYLPISGELSILNDKRFLGVHRGMRDISASFSPKPGMIGLSDRVSGSTSDIMFEVERMTNQNVELKNFSKILGLMNVKYIVVRKNLTHPYYIPGDQIALNLKIDKNIISRRSWINIELFENKNFIPHIYIPERFIVSNADINSLSTIVSDKKYQTSSAIYFTNQNHNLFPKDKLLKYNSEENYSPSLQFQKVNPTHYHVSIQNIKSAFPLVFSEEYNSNWHLFSSKHKKSLFEKNHFISNSYANSWYIDPRLVCERQNMSEFVCSKNSDGSYDLELDIEFTPQKLFHIGLLISTSSLVILFIITVYGLVKAFFYERNNN